MVEPDVRRKPQRELLTISHGSLYRLDKGVLWEDTDHSCSLRLNTETGLTDHRLLEQNDNHYNIIMLIKCGKLKFKIIDRTNQCLTNQDIY